MKIRTIIKSSLVALLAAGLVVTTGVNTARAAEVPAPTTPGFNIYPNVSNGGGNEADFVKLRKNNGDNKAPATQNRYVDPLSAACTVGEKIDVSTYIHNGAIESSNDNGNGTGVAHNVRLTMNAPLNQEKKKNFGFTSTVSASNAASVTDTGTLNCGSDVQLELVPQSVHLYSEPYGWKDLPNSAVNGTTTIGSPTFGSGDMWGCWEYIVFVVYTVEVKPAPTPPPTPVTPVTPAAPKPVALPVTGPGEVLGMVAATSAAGTVAYRTVWLRRRRDDV